MKYLVILGDGMADLPVEELNGKTPLQHAHKPNMDYLAKHGTLGLVKTVPDAMAPGSDIANLSVMGYSPQIYYTGRSPLEALNMGINLSKSDVAIRCNFVTLSNDPIYSNKTLLDYCADEITTKESSELIQTLNHYLSDENIKLITGTSYRHCMVWKNGKIGLNLTPPHDITSKQITKYLPDSPDGAIILDLMKKSYDILKDHPVNIQRIANGKNPANSIWLWGEGKKPHLPLFKEKHGVCGSMISAVDLLKGIALSSGIDVINVEGATGNIHTNFSGKAKAAMDEFDKGKDFVFVHIEAPDECGHQGDIVNKVRAIELIDDLIVGYLLQEMEKFDDYKILLLPDHPTPLSLRTHTSDPVPYVIFHKRKAVNSSNFDKFDELTAKSTNNFVEDGSKLMSIFINYHY